MRTCMRVCIKWNRMESTLGEFIHSFIRLYMWKWEKRELLFNIRFGLRFSTTKLDGMPVFVDLYVISIWQKHLAHTHALKLPSCSTALAVHVFHHFYTTRIIYAAFFPFSFYFILFYFFNNFWYLFIGSMSVSALWVGLSFSQNCNKILCVYIDAIESLRISTKFFTLLGTISSHQILFHFVIWDDL